LEEKTKKKKRKKKKKRGGGQKGRGTRGTFREGILGDLRDTVVGQCQSQAANAFTCFSKKHVTF